MGNESSRAGILVAFIVAVVRGLDVIRATKRALFKEEIDSRKKKNETEESERPKQ